MSGDGEAFCRLCLEKRTIYFSLFDEHNGAEMFESLTSIKVSHDDTVSTSVCSICLLELRTAYNTQQKFIRIQGKLNKRLTGVNNESTEPTTEISGENVVTFMFTKNCPICKSDVPHDDFEQHAIKHTLINVIQSNNKETPKSEEFHLQFTCEKCSEKFDSSKLYVKHLDKHIMKKCDICMMEVPAHEFTVHKIKHSSCQCDICGLRMKNTNSLRCHIRDNHLQVDGKGKRCINFEVGEPIKKKGYLVNGSED